MNENPGVAAARSPRKWVVGTVVSLSVVLTLAGSRAAPESTGGKGLTATVKMATDGLGSPTPAGGGRHSGQPVEIASHKPGSKGSSTPGRGSTTQGGSVGTVPGSSPPGSTTTSVPPGGTPPAGASPAHPSSSTTSTTSTTSAAGGGGQAAAVPGAFRGVIEYAGNNSTADAADPSLAGVDLDYYWSQIEPAKGVYDWSVITTAMAPWVAHGKKVVLRIATAGQASWDPPYSASGTPAWVYADGATSVTDSGETVPVYWNSHYLADLEGFLSAYAAEFNGNPAVAFIEAGVGMGGETMPETNLSSGGLAAWDGAGYSASTWLSTVETISTAYRQDFTRTPVCALLTSSFLGGDWPDYQVLAAWYTDATPAWNLQNDALSATSTLSDPAAWAKASALVLEQAQPASRSGDSLAADGANALALHAEYVLVYRSDIDNPANASALAALAAKAG